MKGNGNSKFLLTHREREVFELLVQDKTTRDIAGQLFISEKTVRNHISNVMWFETHNTCKKTPKLCQPRGLHQLFTHNHFIRFFYGNRPSMSGFIPGFLFALYQTYEPNRHPSQRE